MTARRAPRLLAALALGAFAVAGPPNMAVAAASHHAGPPPARFSPNVRADADEGAAGGQGEAQVAVDAAGVTYVSWMGSNGSQGTAAARTVDGVHFDYLGAPVPLGLGDVVLATPTWPSPDHVMTSEPAGADGVYWSDVGLSPCGAIQAPFARSVDRGATWVRADATCQPAQVDRGWLATYTPPEHRGQPTAFDHTVVYDAYHDWDANEVWVARSLDGGQTWDPEPHLAMQPGSVAMLTSQCDTVPGGAAVDTRGAHPGRLYVLWSTGDAGLSPSCSGLLPYDHLFISWSDDEGVTWTSHTVFNDPCAPNPPAPPTTPFATDGTGCQDTFEEFPALAVDDAGNVYAVFVWRDATSERPEYDIGLMVSTDGGLTWNGGPVDHPGPPLRVNTDTGTHYEPWIAAAGDGAVDVAYYDTPYVEPAAALNKPGAPPQDALWNVVMAQSLDVLGGQRFTQSTVSDHPVLFGDHCTQANACSPAGPLLGWGAHAVLYDGFGLAFGPDGGARVAWTDTTRDSWSSSCGPNVPASPTDANSCQTAQRHAYFACQTGGMGIHGETVTGCGHSLPGAGAAPAPAGVASAGPSVIPTRPRTSPPQLPNTTAGALAAPSLVTLALLGLALALRRRAAFRRSPQSGLTDSRVL